MLFCHPTGLVLIRRRGQSAGSDFPVSFRSILGNGFALASTSHAARVVSVPRECLSSPMPGKLQIVARHSRHKCRIDADAAVSANNSVLIESRGRRVLGRDDLRDEWPLMMTVSGDP